MPETASELKAKIERLETTIRFLNQTMFIMAQARANSLPVRSVSAE